MIAINEIANSANLFNNLKVGDRIFYKKNGHTKTKRVIKKNIKTVSVIENGKEKKIYFDRIFMA